jgi:hypothetical protein
MDRRTLIVIALAACQEVGIKDLPPDVPEPEDSDTPVVIDTPVDTPTPEPPSCDGVILTLDRWVASPPFATQADPTDGAGVAFWASGFNSAGWTSITLPDVGGIPVGQDRVYVGVLHVEGSPPGVSLDLQSDDGIGVWINGAVLGAWGGTWQQEGCVNDDANCLVFQRVDPIDITGRVSEGDNLVAMRVSNPVEGSYADLGVTCFVP